MTESEGHQRQEPLNDDQRLSWLRLARSENVGAITFHRLLQQFGSAEAALDSLPELSARGGAGRTIRICSEDSASLELERANRSGCQIIASCEPLYPKTLRWSDGAPPVMALRGDASVLEKPAVAIVGSRNASVSGRKMTHGLARELGEAGFVIVSGLARGIDAAAHSSALSTGTIAVLAGGLDRPYPPQNIDLLEQICEGHNGAAVSEMPFGWEPRARDFPRRNRIVAGLGLGLVVVEAATKSGSLISARLAGELGRQVFAVPGSPMDPRAKGTNALIKDGAILTTSAQDVLECLRPQLDGQQVSMSFDDGAPSARETQSGSRELSDNERSEIAAALGPTPVDMDDIISSTGLPAADVYLALLELELAGNLERHPGGMVSKPHTG